MYIIYFLYLYVEIEIEQREERSHTNYVFNYPTLSSQSSPGSVASIQVTYFGYIRHALFFTWAVWGHGVTWWSHLSVVIPPVTRECSKDLKLIDTPQHFYDFLKCLFVEKQHAGIPNKRRTFDLRLAMTKKLNP